MLHSINIFICRVYASQPFTSTTISDTNGILRMRKKTNAQVDDIIKVDWARQRFTQLLYYYYHFTYGCIVVFSCTLPWNTFFLFLFLSVSFCIPFFLSVSFYQFLSLNFFLTLSLFLAPSLFLTLSLFSSTSLSLSNSLHHFFLTLFIFRDFFSSSIETNLSIYIAIVIRFCSSFSPKVLWHRKAIDRCMLLCTRCIWICKNKIISSDIEFGASSRSSIHFLWTQTKFFIFLLIFFFTLNMLAKSIYEFFFSIYFRAPHWRG